MGQFSNQLGLNVDLSFKVVIQVSVVVLVGTKYCQFQNSRIAPVSEKKQTGMYFELVNENSFQRTSLLLTN